MQYAKVPFACEFQKQQADKQKQGVSFELRVTSGALKVSSAHPALPPGALRRDMNSKPLLNLQTA